MPSPTQLKWTCCKAYTKLSYFQASLLGYGIGESHSALCCTLTALLTTHSHSTPHTTPSQHSSHNTFTQHSSHNTPHNTLTQHSSHSTLTQHSSHNTLTQHYSHNTLTALIMMRVMCQLTAVGGLTTLSAVTLSDPPCRSGSGQFCLRVLPGSAASPAVPGPVHSAATHAQSMVAGQTNTHCRCGVSDGGRAYSVRCE